jgi:hypothetical protein
MRPFARPRATHSSISGATMTTRQFLLQMRDETEVELGALRSEPFDLGNEPSGNRDTFGATQLKDLSGVLSLLDVRLAIRAIDTLKQ